jgi:polyphosphate kinase
VRSILGRFLEHDRIFFFGAGGDEVILCSSADWMPRNFFRRVELSFPIEGRKNRKRVVREGLEVYLEDNTQAWEMQQDGTYRRVTPGDAEPRSAQRRLLKKLAKLPG